MFRTKLVILTGAFLLIFSVIASIKFTVNAAKSSGGYWTIIDNSTGKSTGKSDCANGSCATDPGGYSRIYVPPSGGKIGGGGDDSGGGGGSTAVAPCHPIAMSCSNACGQVARCASNGCGGQSCCPATGACPTPTPAPSATGGTITYTGQYIVHTFTQSGTFTPLRNLNVEYLIIGGGGAGGGTDGGGGGAGGFRTGSNYPVTANTPMKVTIGNGGAGNSVGFGENGGDSTFGTLIASGGGGGGTFDNNSVIGGKNGGSGGGGSGKSGSVAGGVGNTPFMNPSQGNNGGAGLFSVKVAYNFRPSGGGGGAGGAGSDASVMGSVFRGGDGGVGRESSLSGVSFMYAGGGGGGIKSGSGAPGIGGNGGGGAGGDDTHPGIAGKPNTGSGGGGSASYGGAGGTGIVIIRYIPPSACLKRPQGDANCDDVINIVDFDMFKTLLLQNGKNTFIDMNSKYSADFNNDKKVNLVDYEIWRNTFYH